MITLLTVVLIMLVSGSNTSNITIAELYEIRTLAPGHHYDGANLQFEDGSFVRTVNGESYSGCTPFRLCSGVGIDTPWEDILSPEDAATMYSLVGIYKALQHYEIFRLAH